MIFPPRPTWCLVALAWVGCTPDASPSTIPLRQALKGQTLPAPRARVPKERESELAEMVRTAMGAQRDFKHWPCTVGQKLAMKSQSKGYLTCAVSGFIEPRLLVRAMAIPTDGALGEVFARVEHGNHIRLSGKIAEGSDGWPDLAVENCGLDMKTKAESAIFIEIDVNGIER